MRKRLNTGFSLIELLVVVSLIALLVALLIPALHGAREAARIVRCAAQQRQVGFYLLQYVGENRDTLPLMVEMPNVIVPWPKIMTAAGVLPRNATTATLFQCPSETPQEYTVSTFAGQYGRQPFSYRSNYQALGLALVSGIREAHAGRPARFARPQTFYFITEKNGDPTTPAYNPWNIDWGTFYTDGDVTGYSGDPRGTYWAHQTVKNVLFIDGHVKGHTFAQLLRSSSSPMGLATNDNYNLNAGARIEWVLNPSWMPKP